MDEMNLYGDRGILEKGKGVIVFTEIGDCPSISASTTNAIASLTSLSSARAKSGSVTPSLHDRISQLNLTQLEALAIALLNFSTLATLEAWLESRQG